MRVFIRIVGAIACLVGLGLMLAPGLFYAPQGIALTPLTATLAQGHGATLLGLGVVNLVLAGAGRAGLRAVLIGDLVANLLSLLLAFRTMTLGPGTLILPQMAVHLALAAACFRFLALNIYREEYAGE